MSDPPPAYDANPSPWVPPSYDVTKDQPAANPGFPPPPQFQYMPPGYNPASSHQYNVQPGMVPVIVTTFSFGEDPQQLTCPHCQKQVVTGVRGRNGLLSWLICGGLTLFGCWLCCLIPFCCQRCQDIEHFCPRCHRFLGTYRRI